MTFILAFAFFFALALFCSGQSAGITATLAGQVIGEGFMNWKISVWIPTPLYSLNEDH